MSAKRTIKTAQQNKNTLEGKSTDTDDTGVEVNSISKLERRRRIEDLNEERRLRQELSAF